MKPEWLSVVAAEQLTGVSRWTWRRMAYEGRIASTKVGSRLVLPTSEVDRIMAENLRPRIIA